MFLSSKLALCPCARNRIPGLPNTQFAHEAQLLNCHSCRVSKFLHVHPLPCSCSIAPGVFMWHSLQKSSRFYFKNQLCCLGLPGIKSQKWLQLTDGRTPQSQRLSLAKLKLAGLEKRCRDLAECRTFVSLAMTDGVCHRPRRM